MNMEPSIETKDTKKLRQELERAELKYHLLSMENHLHKCSSIKQKYVNQAMRCENEFLKSKYELIVKQVKFLWEDHKFPWEGKEAPSKYLHVFSNCELAGSNEKLATELAESIKKEEEMQEHNRQLEMKLAKQQEKIEKLQVSKKDGWKLNQETTETAKKLAKTTGVLRLLVGATENECDELKEESGKLFALHDFMVKSVEEKVDKLQEYLHKGDASPEETCKKLDQLMPSILKEDAELSHGMLGIDTEMGCKYALAINAHRHRIAMKLKFASRFERKSKPQWKRT